MRRWALWPVVVFACSGSGGRGGGACFLSTARSVQFSLCDAVFSCGTELGLTQEQIQARYGANLEECVARSDIEFVTNVMSYAPGPPTGAPPDDPSNAYWRRLLNCETAIVRAECAVLGEDVLLQDGGYCGADVLQLMEDPPDNLVSSECFEAL